MLLERPDSTEMCEKWEKSGQGDSPATPGCTAKFSVNPSDSFSPFRFESSSSFSYFLASRQRKRANKVVRHLLDQTHDQF